MLKRILFLSIFASSLCWPNAQAEEGILHLFYSFDLKIEGRLVASINTSKNVVLGTPITETIPERGQVSLLFEERNPDGYLMLVTIREALAEQKESFDLAVEYRYEIAINEELQFSTQSQSGLEIMAKMKLERVNRLEVAT